MTWNSKYDFSKTQTLVAQHGKYKCDCGQVFLACDTYNNHKMTDRCEHIYYGSKCWECSKG